MKRASSTILTLAISGLAAVCFAQGPGQFESASDVGVTPQKGKAAFDAASGEYRVTGGGANIWGTADAFQFAWKKMSGDVALTADESGVHLAKTPQIQVVTAFFGGQGTINVNSWAPDSKRFAYVIYEPLPSGAASR